MKTIPIKDKLTPPQIEELGLSIDEIEKRGGLWEIVIRKPVRTNKQNRMIHAVFSEISNRLEEHGLDNIKLQVPPTPEALKAFFKASYLGKPTSMADTKELSDAFDRFLRQFNKSFANHGLPPISVDNEEFKSLMSKI